MSIRIKKKGVIHNPLGTALNGKHVIYWGTEGVRCFLCSTVIHCYKLASNDSCDGHE